MRLSLLLRLLPTAAVAFAAYRAGVLSLSGTVAACGVGGVVAGFGGWVWAAALVTFFVTSSGLSRWRRAAKAGLGYEKGGQRDAGQVLANGGIAGLCALLPFTFPRMGEDRAYLMFLAALAAANADTWATEIGSAFSRQPYSLRTGRQAAPGTSGAVSAGGTLAALAGAAVIGLFAHDWRGRALVTAAGVGGALFDSILGATVQAQWRDPARADYWTERPQPVPPARGWHWVSNDVVNLGCTLMAAALAWAMQK